MIKLSEIQKILEATSESDKINITTICKAISISRQTYYDRIASEDKDFLKPQEIKKIEKEFGVKLKDKDYSFFPQKLKEVVDYLNSDDITKHNRDIAKFKAKNHILVDDKTQILENNIDDDCINVEYIGICPSCGVGTMVIDEPEIRKIKLSNDLITHILKCTDPENLKVFKAKGDSMESLIEDGDLLLVDIGRVDVYNAGIYVFSIDNDWRVKRFRLRIDKVLEIISDNPKYDIELIMPDSNIDLKIRGKVIKNLSRGL